MEKNWTWTGSSRILSRVATPRKPPDFPSDIRQTLPTILFMQIRLEFVGFSRPVDFSPQKDQLEVKRMRTLKHGSLDANIKKFRVDFENIVYTPDLG